MKTVYIDPGHGDAGGDMGAIGAGQIKEADINLSIALKLKEMLNDKYRVILSRETQKGTLPISSDALGDLPARVEAANKNNADIFISIHCNSHTVNTAEGTEIFYCQGSENGKKLAGIILNEILYQQKLKIASTNSNWWRFANRGIKASSDLYVLNHTDMPAILCETLFMSNSTNLALLQTPVFHEIYATAIKSGVDKYFNKTSVPEPPPQAPKRFIDGDKLKEVADQWVYKEFNPGKVEQCAAFVRYCLKQAGYESIGVTKAPSDGYKASETNAFIADSFAGDDIGLRISKRTDLIPGDIIMFYDTYNDGTFKENSLTHVGICVGNNNFVHRPTAAKPVLKQDISEYGFRWEARRLYLTKELADKTPITPVNNVVYKDPKFSALVSKYCKLYNLSERYIHSIIQQESRYDPNAISKHNAQGLMQLLPVTFKECSKELHLTGDVWDPETNIACGTYYMRKIANKIFPGVKILNRDQYYIVASSYNQGPSSDGTKYSMAVMGRVPSV